MLSTSYPSIPEYQAHMNEARRLRAACVARVFAQIGRRLSDLIPSGWTSAAAR